MNKSVRIKLSFRVALVGLCFTAVLAGVYVRAIPTPSAAERFHAIRVEPATGPNILLVVIDTLRADHVGLYGYHRPTTPSIDSFFGQSRIYERVYAASPCTVPSMVSVLTGLYPHRHGVRLLCQKVPEDSITFVDHLRRAGYQTAAVISNAVLTDRASALGSRFEYYDDLVDEQEPFRKGMFERRAKRTTDAAIKWLTSKRDATRPHFLWVHYIDPHGPYRPPADKPVDFSHHTPVLIDPERVPKYAREPDLYDGEEYVDRYDEEIAYTDREVGRLLDSYTDLGLADRALIIFTSDHGESMMEHENWFRHEHNVYEEMVRIPLAIRYPGAIPGRETVAVSNTDIAPTVLQVVGLPVPKGLDGVSLLPKPKPRDIFCEGRTEGGGLWRGLIRGNRKTVVRHGRMNIVRESRAFDLIQDPGELRPLPVPPNDPALRILEDLVGNDPHPGGFPPGISEFELPGISVAPTDDPVVLQQLRSLGYVGDD